MQDYCCEFRVSDGCAFDPFLEISTIAQLSDDIAIAIGEECLMKAENMGVIHQLQNFDFLEDEGLESLGLELVKGDGFDGNGFLYVWWWVLVSRCKAR